MHNYSNNFFGLYIRIFEATVIAVDNSFASEIFKKEYGAISHITYQKFHDIQELKFMSRIEQILYKRFHIYSSFTTIIDFTTM